MKKKGIDFLLKAAHEMREVPFLVVGIHQSIVDLARRDAPPNVEFVSYIPRDNILPYYQRAKVYCQPSYTEGLPNSICEAMLCECVPVGTAVGGIPTAVTGIGELVSYGDVAALVAALKKALVAADAVGHQARNRIATEFTLERRERTLVQIIRELAA
jgi:glycosyltransferase involved in cell wall biosynthesis